MTKKLGKLEKVAIRDVWPNEATHFTPWLATKENIDLLAEEISLDLEVVSYEERVGPFRADILCRETSANFDHYVLIENQFGKTDHTHLGQLMTYASGLSAVTIIWIAEKFTEEHRSALDWLNRITDDSVDFFGIEIELYRIGDSLPAPMFHVVSMPNNWFKSVRRNTDSSGITDTKRLQQEYWQALKEFAELKKCAFKLQKPSPQHWTNISIGKSSFYISVLANTRDKLIAVQFIITNPNAEENFRILQEKFEAESKKEISEDVEWEFKDGGKQHHVTLRFHDIDPLLKDEWPGQHELLIKYIDRFVKFFKPRIKDL